MQCKGLQTIMTDKAWLEQNEGWSHCFTIRKQRGDRKLGLASLRPPSDDALPPGRPPSQGPPQAESVEDMSHSDHN